MKSTKKEDFILDEFSESEEFNKEVEAISISENQILKSEVVPLLEDLIEEIKDCNNYGFFEFETSLKQITDILEDNLDGNQPY